MMLFLGQGMEAYLETKQFIKNIFKQNYSLPLKMVTSDIKKAWTSRNLENSNSPINLIIELTLFI